MKMVQMGKPRAIVTESAEGLEIRIPAKRHWAIIVFLMFWLVFWMFGEIMALEQLISGNEGEGDPVVILWLLGWTLGGAICIYIILRSFFGAECVSIKPSVLSIKRDLFGLGRERGYYLDQVRHLRVSRQVYNPFDMKSGLMFWGIGGGLIAFDYGASDVRFGQDLDEAEARQLVERMVGQVPAIEQLTDA